MKNLLAAIPCLLALAACSADVRPAPIGDRPGFTDLGVIANTATDRGVVATTGAGGHDVVLSWLFDHRGCYGLLYVDTTTGAHQQFALPFDNTEHDAPFASILSSGNKFYTYFDNHFIEFDPVKKAYTFVQQTLPQMAMSMTEDAHGTIWAAAYPTSNLVAFDPHTRTLKAYGSIYQQNWQQYPRYLAADSAGWIYASIGFAKTQIVAFNPATGQRIPLIAEADRTNGTIPVYEGADKNVYAKLGAGPYTYVRLYDGKMAQSGVTTAPVPANLIAGAQTLHYTKFPDGNVLQSFSLAERTLSIKKKSGGIVQVPFDFTSDGALGMGVAVGPGGDLVASTTFPMQFATFDPRTGAHQDYPAIGQFNALQRGVSVMYFGSYPYGRLLRWNPRTPFVATTVGNSASNPGQLAQASPAINRPSRVLAMPSGDTVLMGGTPDYGNTGGGLLVWHNGSTTSQLLSDTQLAANQSVETMVALDGRNVLIGTTTDPGSGGMRKATSAELLGFDTTANKVTYRVPLPGVQTIDDLVLANNGMVYGIADRRTLFVFNPKTRTVIARNPIASAFGNAIVDQGPRVFVKGGNGTIYVLFTGKIGRIDLRTNTIDLVANSPVPITAGGDYLDGHIYFISQSHLYGYRVD